MKNRVNILATIFIVVLVGMVEVANAFYDPGLQRRINRDPIKEEGGLNLFQFTGNEPVSRFDPRGLDQCGITFEGEFALFELGIDVGLSLVLDTSNLGNSGLYTSFGGAQGFSIGAGAGFIYAPESIAGNTINLDVNAGLISPTINLDPLNSNILVGGALTGFLPGVGIAASETATDPLFRWSDISGFLNDFFDNWLSPWSQLNRSRCTQ